MQNKKQQKNRLFKAGIITVFVALLSLTLVSGTYASYTSQKTAEDTASVAKWEWKNGDENFENATFDLFNTTLYELDANDNVITTDANGDTEVNQDKEGMVAPGTGGYITLKIKNLSDVDGRLEILFTETAGGEITNITNYIEFSLTNETDSWTDDITDLDLKYDADTTKDKSKKLEHLTGTADVTVYWRWIFTDSTLGADGNSDEVALQGKTGYKVSAKLIVTQID